MDKPRRMSLDLFKTIVRQRTSDGTDPDVLVWYVVARAVDSKRYWYDYRHDHKFAEEGPARKLQERIQEAWGDKDGTIPEWRFAASSHWMPNHDSDPIENQLPFGWEGEKGNHV